MNTLEHLLVCLMEECAEVQQAASKSLRFGLDDKYPEKPTNNREDLRNELTDLNAIVELLMDAGAITPLPRLEHAAQVERKRLKVRHWMEYARHQGTLEAV